MTITLSDEDLRLAAGNLLQAFVTRACTPPMSQGRVIADIGFTVLCEVGARAGLAQSPGQLELVIADVVEQLPPPGGTVAVDGGPDWTWLMQARFLLARRLRMDLGGGVEPGGVAA